MEDGEIRGARLAVCASGSGSTFRHLAQCCASGRFAGAVALLVTTKADAAVAEYADTIGVEHLFLDADAFDPAGLDDAMCQALLERRIDLVVLAGYL